jgi:L-arabinose isomerase
MKQFLLALCLLASCNKAEPTLDASSEKATTSSLQQMLRSLPTEEAKKLEDAFTNLAMQRATGSIMSGTDPTQAVAASYSDLHGMTAKQIVAVSESTTVRLNHAAVKARAEADAKTADTQKLRESLQK